MGVALLVLWMFSPGPFFCVFSVMLVKTSHSFTQVTCGPCPVLEAFPGRQNNSHATQHHPVKPSLDIHHSCPPQLLALGSPCPPFSPFTCSDAAPQPLLPGETPPCPSPFLILPAHSQLQASSLPVQFLEQQILNKGAFWSSSTAWKLWDLSALQSLVFRVQLCGFAEMTDAWPCVAQGVVSDSMIVMTATFRLPSVCQTRSEPPCICISSTCVSWRQ